ncbi:MAG: methyltransferase domain-containing protein [Solirubrobacteraceae bacterium]
MAGVSGVRYDAIGRDYARTRRADPRLAERIECALGDARSVLNVGAGAGSYEPRDRYVVAVEPSDVMAAQRPRELAPAIRCSAGAIPLRDDSVDGAMAVLSIHHWDDEQQAGVLEMRRIARDAVVIVTYDPLASGEMWLMRDYLPEVADLDRRIFPAPQLIVAWLGGNATVDVLPIPSDTPDWMLGSFWAHPERVLDPAARAATSGLARMAPATVDRVVAAVADDLESGAWDERYGDLRELEEYDVGLRLIVAT